MNPAIPQIAVFVSPPFEENTYVLHQPGNSMCLVVDPGFTPEDVIDHISAENLTPVAILLTHGHSDHIGGNEALKRRWPECPILIGRGDAPKLADPWQNLSGQFGIPITSPPSDRLLDDNEILELAGLRLEVRHTPGHSAGHVVYVIQQVAPVIVIGGDVLFAGGVGRTDFPDGDSVALVRSIHTRLFSLPDETMVLPGHGPATTIGVERRENPFVGVNSRRPPT